MHQPLHEQITRLENMFDTLHEFLCESEGNNSEVTITALKGALFCKALYCDILNEQGDE